MIQTLRKFAATFSIQNYSGLQQFRLINIGKITNNETSAVPKEAKDGITNFVLLNINYFNLF